MNGLQRWHDFISSPNPNPDMLDDLLAEDCVFHSPIVHTPQEGRAITKLYLSAAGEVLGGDSFHYVREVVDGNQAVLEFRCENDGIGINGVDMITFNDAGQITDFKVMVRPLKAINLVHAQMKQMLEQMAS